MMMLMRPRILSLRNSLTAAVLIRRLPFPAIGAGVCWLLYFGMSYLLSFVRDAGFAGEIVSETLFSVIISGLFLFLILSNIITALSSFYLSKDVAFFLSKPVPLPAILRLKFFESRLASAGMGGGLLPAGLFG